MAPDPNDIYRRHGEEFSMEKIWLKHYPAGVPAEIDPNRYQADAQTAGVDP